MSIYVLGISEQPLGWVGYKDLVRHHPVLSQCIFEGVLSYCVRPAGEGLYQTLYQVSDNTFNESVFVIFLVFNPDPAPAPPQRDKVQLHSEALHDLLNEYVYVHPKRSRDVDAEVLSNGNFLIDIVPARFNILHDMFDRYAATGITSHVPFGVVNA